MIYPSANSIYSANSLESNWKKICVVSISIQYLLKIPKVVTINNGTVFLNNFSGSKIEEGVPFKLKVTDHSELSIAQVQEENSGT